MIVIKKGFTLIELIASLAIFSIILSMAAFSFHVTGIKNFNTGDTQTNLQTNLRAVANYITNEVRFCSNPQILDKLPDTFDNSKKYIYISNNTIKQYYNGTEKNILFTTGKNINAAINFIAQDYRTISFKISGTDKQTYTIDSSTQVLNIGSDSVEGNNGEILCYSEGTPSVKEFNSKPVISISISASSSEIFMNGGTVQLNASVAPSDASIKSVTWTIDKTSDATINSDGLMQTKSTATEGEIIVVTAYANDGSGVSATYNVTVKKNITNILMSSFSVASDYDYIFKGGVLKINAVNILPLNTTNKSVTWTVDKTSDANINGDGLLQTTSSAKDGEIIIVTATANDGLKIQASKNITVKTVTGIEISNDGTLVKNGNPIQLYCVLSPIHINADSNNIKQILWSAIGDGTIDNLGKLKYKTGNKKSITVNVEVTTLDGNKFTTTKTFTTN